MIQTKMQFLIDKRESKTRAPTPPCITQSIPVILVNISAATILNNTYTSGATQIIKISTDDERIGTIAQRIGNGLRLNATIGITELQVLVDVMDFLTFSFALAFSRVVGIGTQMNMNQGNRCPIDIGRSLIDNHIVTNEFHSVLIKIGIVTLNLLHIQMIGAEIAKRIAAVN